jgi:hypothetical protein
MSTFFVIDRCMGAIILDLLGRGLAIPYETMPVARLRSRLNVLPNPVRPRLPLPRRRPARRDPAPDPFRFCGGGPDRTE